MMNFISAEQTFSYMPPEALFGNAWLQGPTAARAKYESALQHVQ